MKKPTTEAFQDFAKSVHEVKTLLHADRRPETSLPARGQRSSFRDLENALCRAAMVMLVAHFEGFIKSLLEEFVDEISNAKPPTRRLPDAFLELYTKERIQEIPTIEKTNERIHRTRRLFSVYAGLWDPDRSIDPRLISGKLLARQFTNAGPDSLNKVLDIIGATDSITAIRGHLQDSTSHAGIDVATKLSEIVDRRNKIAHGDLNEKPTQADVTDYLAFLLAVAQVINDIVSRQIDLCCSLR